MRSAHSFSLLIVGCLAMLSAPLRADTNQALTELLSTLVRNGSLTKEQADLIRQLEKSASPSQPLSAPAPASATTVSTAGPGKAVPVYAMPKEKGISRLIISGKIHSQWDSLKTEVSNGPELPARNSFLMRRLQLAATGYITEQWSGLVEADFAASNTIEQGYISYKGVPDMEINFGYTKVPFLREEQISDSVIKAVERSASHRAFVEQPGRGFGAKNTGVHLKGKLPRGFHYAAAVTNPGAKNSAGTAGNVANQPAYYARLGFSRALGSGLLECGIDGGYLPDLLAAGPISATAAHLRYDVAALSLMTEFITASYARPGPDARQTGFMIEPSFKFTREWELVLRYSTVDSDGLGLSPGALIRNAPATGDFDQLKSFYVGGNYYFLGNAVRLTFGYEYAKATGRITGAAAENTINGLRSRMQFLF